MTASAGLALWLRDWQTPDSLVQVLALFGIGGAISFPFGLFTARFFGLGRSREVAFASAFLGLSILTIGITGLAFALLYRSYYSEWHADLFSMTWTFQLVFTTVGALAQFAVLGTRLYFPLGFLAVIAVSLWFSARAR